MKEGEGEGNDENGRWMAYAQVEDFLHYHPIAIEKTIEEKRKINWINVVIQKHL